MSTQKTFGSHIIAAMREAVAIEHGEAKPVLVRRHSRTVRSATVASAPSYGPKEIAGLREKMELSQPLFADVLNVSPNTVRAWEQGKRAPDGAAVRLLQVMEEHPAWMLAKVKATPRKAKP